MGYEEDVDRFPLIAADEWMRPRLRKLDREQFLLFAISYLAMLVHLERIHDEFNCVLGPGHEARATSAETREVE